MDTEALRLFVLAADALNISAAGRQLGMAPSIASAKLAKLEKSIGTELLHRSTRKVSLSLDGADFLPYAREIVAQENAGLAALGGGVADVTGTVRFTAPSSFAQLYLMPLIPDFLSAHPGVSLDLRLSDLPLDLMDGAFDLALRSVTAADSSLKGRKLARDYHVLCAAPSYLAMHGTPETAEDLARHELIAFRNQDAHGLLENGEASGSFDPAGARSRLTVDDGTSQRLATIAGAGISMNSVWSIYHDLEKGHLVRVLPNHVVDDQTGLWLLYPQSNVLSPKVRVLIDFLVEWAKNAPELRPLET